MGETKSWGWNPELLGPALNFDPACWLSFINPPWTSISSLPRPTFSLESWESKRSKEVGTQDEKVRGLCWELGGWEGKDRAPFL